MSQLKDYLTEAGVPATLHDQAVASLQSARKPALIRFWLGLTAPIVWVFIAAFLPRKAEQLPRWLRWYDNNVNLNGDRAEWARLGDGPPVRLPNLDKAVVYEDGQSNSYWPPHSPRSFLPRWSFNGWRNRCGWLAKKWGKPLQLAIQDGKPVPDEAWGNPNQSRSEMGTYVVRAGDVWELRRTSKHLGGVKVQSFGYEILNSNEIDRFATCTWTPWSWKGKK